MSGRLYHKPSDVIQQLLIDLGIATDPADDGDWPVYESVEPDQPDNCITVYTTTGIKQGRVSFGTSILKYGIQIRIRAQDDAEGDYKARDIYQAFDEDVLRTSVIISDDEEHEYLVQEVANQGDVIPLGYELPASRRKVFVINCLVSMRWVGSIGTGSGTGS